MARTRIEQDKETPIGLDTLTACGRAHFEAIRRTRADLNDADVGLAIEAARLYGLLQVLWRDMRHEDPIVTLSNGMTATNPKLRLIDTTQRQLAALHRALGVRAIDKPGAETGEDPIEELLRVVK